MNITKVHLFLFFIICPFFIDGAFCQSKAPALGYVKSILLFADDFAVKLDTANWKVEMDPQPNSKVFVKNKQLVLDTKGGVTVWLKKKLSGNFMIEYDRTVLVDSGKNDRLSDLNNFWMATDPENPNLFTRNGVLETYDSLRLYYVGMGGNTNKTNRFRKYEGNGQRTLLQEFTDSAHLLKPNTSYHITIICKNGTTRFLVDGKLFFGFSDPNPLLQGYFGFRSTKSRQAVGGFKIWKLE